jgi:hypothetical protein
VRVLLTATPALVKQGRINIELRGSHVPEGVQAVPPPLNGLRIDPHLRQQLVTVCKSSKQTPTTAIADLMPGLKLAQRSVAAPPAHDVNDDSGRAAGEEGHSGSGSGNALPPLNNSRFNPRPSAVAGALKRLRRALRGPAAVGDWERVNMLVR